MAIRIRPPQFGQGMPLLVMPGLRGTGSDYCALLALCLPSLESMRSGTAFENAWTLARNHRRVQHWAMPIGWVMFESDRCKGLHPNFIPRP